MYTGGTIRGKRHEGNIWNDITGTDITGERRPFRGEIIKDSDGTILTDGEDVLRRWKEYIEELFDDERGDKPEVMDNLSGPEIMQEEVRQVVRDMKNEKADGGDGVVTLCWRLRESLASRS